MVDAVNGWAVSGASILYSRDAGRSWEDISPAGLAGSEIPSVTHFRDARTAWVAYSTGEASTARLFRTSNGGLSWEESPLAFNPWRIQFLDPQHGYAMVNLGAAAGSMAVDLYRSDDAGATWALVYHVDPQSTATRGVLPFGGDKNGFTFRDLEHGWVTGFQPVEGAAYLYKTSDGGQTWNPQTLTVPTPYTSGQLTVDPPRFFDEQNGILPVLLTADSSTWIFYITRDGGETWTSTAVSHATGVYSLPTFQDFYIYDGATLTASHDGGQSWAPVQTSLPQPGAQVQLDFVDASRGWVLANPGESASLYSTKDGGQTWQPVQSGGGAATSPAPSSLAVNQVLGLSANGPTWVLATPANGASDSLVVLSSPDGKTWASHPVTGAAPAWIGEPGNLTHARRITLVDSQHAYVYGPGLFVTSDGGATWQPGILKDGVATILASSPDSVWALTSSCAESGGCALRLLSGSFDPPSWQPVEGFAPLQAGEQVSFVHPDAQNAYLLVQGLNHQGLALWATVDAGQTWSQVATPCAAGLGLLDAAPDGALWLVCAGGSGAGQQQKTAYLSIDGGKSWAERPGLPTAGYADAVLALSKAQAVVGLGRFTLLQTQDGGQSWVEAAPLDTANPSASDGWTLSRDPQSGQLWAGLGQQVLTSSDAGQSWQIVPFK